MPKRSKRVCVSYLAVARVNTIIIVAVVGTLFLLKIWSITSPKPRQKKWGRSYTNLASDAAILIHMAKEEKYHKKELKKPKKVVAKK